MKIEWGATLVCFVFIAFCVAASVAETTGAGQILEGEPKWGDFLPPKVLLFSFFCLCASAFFSSSETAFYSLHPLRLRIMRESSNPLERLAARLMDHPGSLLTTILMGNCTVNVFLGVALGTRLEMAFQAFFPLASIVNYILAVALSTAILVLFGEILPKVLAVSQGERIVPYAALPIYLVDRAFWPLRTVMLLGIQMLFRVTRFSEVRPAPFMTDDEFKAMLSEGEASGVIEEDKRQMIQGILEFSDALVREILVPRPDMVALKSSATVGEALALIREHEYARIPVYVENLDDITGVLYAKDLLPAVDGGELEQPILPLLHPVHFVPETMTIASFVRTAQRLRSHLLIAVDEFGGTEGLVTLQDALREVVGDIGEEDDEEPGYYEISPGLYHLDGSFSLDALEELIGRQLEACEHTTVVGFLMDKTEKLLEAGDEICVDDVRYTVESMDGKRVSALLVQLPAEEEAQ